MDLLVAGRRVRKEVGLCECGLYVNQSRSAVGDLLMGVAVIVLVRV